MQYRRVKQDFIYKILESSFSDIKFDLGLSAKIVIFNLNKESNSIHVEQHASFFVIKDTHQASAAANLAFHSLEECASHIAAELFKRKLMLNRHKPVIYAY